MQPPAPASRRRALLGLAAAPLLLGRAAPTALAAQGLAAPVPIPAPRRQGPEPGGRPPPSLG